MKSISIKFCLDAREKAILIPSSHTKVGAVVYSDTDFAQGYNIQNRCHKSYHAEEIALLNYILRGLDPKEIKGIVVSFSANDIQRITFCCGHCRQILWEYTQNPDLLVTEIDLDGNVIKEEYLEDLYPHPYPR